MKESIIDITSFKRASDFYGSINLILTVKSFDLQAIRKRYLRSKQNKSGKTGSVERREPALGGVVAVQLHNGDLKQEQILCKTAEPRGLHFKNNRFAVANEQAVYVFKKNGAITELKDPWFSYIHTVQFHPTDPERILISSSGFDLIREYNFSTKELTFEWLSWEHGFNQAQDPDTGETVHLTRNSEDAEKFVKQDEQFQLISNPEKDHLPTAKRAAFINSVTYHPKNPDQFLATFFHEGKVYQINRKSKDAQAVITGLKNPHGGHISDEKFIATSTGQGEIVIQHENLKQRIQFQNIPGKPDYLDQLEWVQNTLSYENLLISIDSNRTNFVVIDPQRKVYDLIPFDQNWAVQDLAFGKLNELQIGALSQIT